MVQNWENIKYKPIEMILIIGLGNVILKSLFVNL